MYDMNKQVLAQQQPMTAAEIDTKLENVITYFVEQTNQKYYMMLCREQNDYTIFSFAKERNYETLRNELKICFDSRGIVYSINPDNNGGEGIEIWIKNIDGEMNCYLFFPYNIGVIEI